MPFSAITDTRRACNSFNVAKAGHDAPTANPVVQDALKGIRRTIGAAPRRKSAATRIVKGYAKRVGLDAAACAAGS